MSKSISIPILIKDDQKKESVETLALIDSGAGGEFIDQNYAKKSGLKIQKLEEPLIARNVDGTENKRGRITSFVDAELKVNGKIMKLRLYVTGLGRQKVILGFPWLNEYNPEIDWKTGRFTWKTPFRRVKIKRFHEKHPLNTAKELVQQLINDAIVEEKDVEEHLNRTQNPTYHGEILRFNELDEVIPTLEEREILNTWVEKMEKEAEKPSETWINAKTSDSIEFHLKHDEKKQDLPIEKQIPEEYHEYLDVFDEEKADRFPESRIWDHKIEVKEGFQPKSFKTYNLTPEEQIELDKFLKENSEKGYIRPSKSPMASPFFFVKKKDGKLRPCQDYRYLNDWTIKNAYPLPLITELTDKIKDAKYFTKLDVRWGYNNVRIKDGDQWKAAFKTNRGLFEPTVMFFGMCNSPATFQAMMDSIFHDLIEECIVIIYMDDIFIFAKNPQTLEQNTKRVLQRLRENDLFLKPKKC